jgi:hypothetical protein
MSTRSGLVYNNTNKTILPAIRTVNTQASSRPQRSNRTKFSAEIIRELCQESDDDDSLDYSTEDEEVQQYTRHTFVPIPPPPKYEVNIDFDDASEAWRANKRRIGQQWAYRRPQAIKHTENIDLSTLRRSPRNANK